MQGSFAVEERYRQALLSGLNEISTTLCALEEIERYEIRTRVETPWIQSLPLWKGESNKMIVSGFGRGLLQSSSLEW